MHVEPPSHAPTNLKELGVHYLMIVAGILTALGLEAGFEALHHRRLARHTVEQVETELQANLAEVRVSLTQNRAGLDRVQALYGEIKKLAQQREATPGVLKDLLHEKLRIGVVTPSLRRDAWDTAVADQALVHLPHDDLRRLSEAYTGQREAQQAIQTSFSAIGSFARLTDAAVDAEFGRGDPVDLLKALQAYRLTLNAVVGVEEGLEKQLAQSLGRGAAEPAASAASGH